MYSPFSFLFPPLYICKTKKVRHNYIQETYVHPTHEKIRTD
ncbi:hypothetical protein BMG_2414 [Priestia megaterium]|nr:hypothetical protein BMG_2414 [Priestia megaterium]